MAIDAFNALKSFLGVIWTLFTGWNLPFTQMSPAQLIFLGLVIRATIKILNSVLTVNPIGLGLASDEIHRAVDRHYKEKVYNESDWV